MKYPAYPDHRPVHSPALKQLPAHWQLKRLRFATTGIEQGWSPQCDNEVADDERWGVMKVGCVNGDQFDPLENKALPENLDPMPAYELQPGDVLVSRANTKELVGSAAMVPEGVRPRLLLCDKLFRIRPQTEVQARFLTYVLRTPAARYQYERDATGASGSMQNIGQDTIKNLSIPLPSADEQTVITDFLDWRTAQIDALITKKTHLIALLEELRQSFIDSRTASETAMQPVGTATQKQTRLKYVTSAIIDCPHETPAYEPEGDYRVVRTADINCGVLRLDDLYRVDGSEYQRRVRRGAIKRNDILYSREGERWGHAALSPSSDDLCLGQRMMQIKPAQDVDAAFLMWQMNSAWVYQQGEVDTVGSTAPHVNVETIRNYVLYQPHIDDQVERAREITEQVARIHHLMEKARDAILKLHEYRSALITAAVTGQIDVRGVPVPA